MEQEKKELSKKLEDMVKEYNELADRYNKLIDDKAELERKNRLMKWCMSRSIAHKPDCKKEDIWYSKRVNYEVGGEVDNG